jgi:hypothetical protein
MKILAVAFISAVLAGAPCAGLAAGGYMPKPSRLAEPCGSGGGGLPDPAVMQRCLAGRYHPPKAKGPPPSPPANAADPQGR